VQLNEGIKITTKTINTKSSSLKNKLRNSKVNQSSPHPFEVDGFTSQKFIKINKITLEYSNALLQGAGTIFDVQKAIGMQKMD